MTNTAARRIASLLPAIAITADQLAQLTAEVNVQIAARRAESARLAASDNPPWPGFTPQCGYECRRGCDH